MPLTHNATHSKSPPTTVSIPTPRRKYFILQSEIHEILCFRSIPMPPLPVNQQGTMLPKQDPPTDSLTTKTPSSIRVFFCSQQL
ncbi:hypothetical protein B0T14DRAFT_338869 [Immersiella caudata]|uniref:Uncharacterized protein n=1 Tax=Immersiella caudata TaxID=314043 RepID=A0AA39WC66_9PEZI|nr:hypothetical protein B0T14DRAFT_338869 [Immersiella caudata]